MRSLRVEATWDDEASVWVATSEDIPGLATEADTIEELRTKLIALVPELMAENGEMGDGASSLPIDIVATQHLLINAA